MRTITLAMIMKNEEDNLHRLFASIQGCFDEIVIADTGSTDNSVEVAKSLGATVYHFDWVSDFSAARNFIFTKATKDFVMWLDLDDVLENREGFLRFKETMMPVGDYFLVPYHYSSDANDRPICTFFRERVVRRNRNFKWKYAIHEGMLPDTVIQPVRILPCDTWAVRHRRTDEDLKKDRSRNLQIFETLEKENKLDARLRYYYGKELFENGRPLEAVRYLGDAMKDPALEIHDRLLAMQYTGHCYIQCNQFELAIQISHQGLQLAPHRAEFHTTIADAYMKLGKHYNSVPFYEAAKRCSPAALGPVSNALFSTPDLYGPYPCNQLARIYYFSGEMDKAEDQAREGMIRGGGEESRQLFEEIKKAKAYVTSFKDAKPCEDIVITTPPQTAYTFDPETRKTKALGGSETAMVEMAYWLKKLSGKRVVCFNMRATDGEFDGVEYKSAERVADYFTKHKPALHIAWRHTLKITEAPTYVWCHDITTQNIKNVGDYAAVLALTPFHKNWLMVTEGLPDDKIIVTRNGLSPDLFKFETPIEKDPNRFVFGSSPDRGLDRAIRVLKRVREKHPLVTLHIHYGWDHFPNDGHLGALKKVLVGLVEENKDWITYHGATQQRDLMKSYMQSSYVCQPSDWIETSCISAMEFLCCGVYPIFRKIGGVADTLKEASETGMASLVDSDCITESEYQTYVDETIRCLDESRALRVKMDPEKVSWERVSQQWLDTLYKGVNGQSG